MKSLKKNYAVHMVWMLILISVLACRTTAPREAATLSAIVNKDVVSPIKPTTPPTQHATLFAMSTPTQTAEPSPIPAYRIGSTKTNPVDSANMVYIPEGEFIMGTSDDQMDWILSQAWCGYCQRQYFLNEQPAHPVFLDAYWIYQTEVTNAQYADFVSATGYRTTAEVQGKAEIADGSGIWPFEGISWADPWLGVEKKPAWDLFPVTLVSWDDAAAYCEWAGGRLPTEAEWEKAARGTDARVFPWGDGAPGADLVNLGIPHPPEGPVGEIIPVGSFPQGSSPYGALDMAGNVMEWVADWYDEAYYSISPYQNPPGPDSGEQHVLRGGSWNAAGGSTRAAYRSGLFWDREILDIYGFRCVVREP